jgi:hypothetical protein
MHTRSDPLVTLTLLLSLTAAPVLAAPDNKSTSEQRPDLTTSNPTGQTIPGTATTTPQSAGDQGNVSANSTGAANARRSGPSINGSNDTHR